MIKHSTFFAPYDWDITLFCNVSPSHSQEIMRCLWCNGINSKDYYGAEELLLSGRPNEGLTYNNPRTHSSIVVIGHVSNIWELIDTIEHEGRHLVQGICNAYRINPNSEKAAYLEGALFKQILKEMAYKYGF